MNSSDALPDLTPAESPAANNPAQFSSEHSFTLHSLGDLQRSVGALSAHLAALNAQVDAVKGRIDRSEADITTINSKISWVYGAAAALTAILALLAFLISNIPWDKIKIG